jgi:Patatin-like phospholipase
VDDTRFLDELRPFRRGELALARRETAEPGFLPPGDRDLLRYALRLAQLSTLSEPDDLLDRIDSFRLRLLQLLGPVLPTDPGRLDPRALHGLAPRVAHLVAGARRQAAGLSSETDLDDILADKRVALVMGGAGGAGFVFLGALAALEEEGITPSYQLGTSIGALIAALRARTRRYDLEGLLEQAKRIEAGKLYGAPEPPGRYGLPGALRFDPRSALSWFFTREGEPVRLGDLHIPTDVLATGLRPAALTRARGEYADVLGRRIDDPEEVAHLRPTAVTRIASVLVELAVSRRVFVPVLLGADPATARLEAMDAAGFSAAIPAMLHYDVFRADPDTDAILDRVFDRHGLAALVDGALADLIPAHLAWRTLEGGRIGTRNVWIVAMDAMVAAGGRNRLLLPVQRVLAATLQRDRAYWDLYVPFRNTPFVFDIVPRPELLRRAADDGRAEMRETAALLRTATAPLPRWSQIESRVPDWK